MKCDMYTHTLSSIPNLSYKIKQRKGKPEWTFEDLHQKATSRLHLFTGLRSRPPPGRLRIVAFNLAMARVSTITSVAKVSLTSVENCSYRKMSQ